ncbi:Polysaccharide monooxygenase Cel61a [Leucoagaricus sp. SymC.cos]|nr:Polysaccharide monooxygenase Cel61a [Leucoagaricus sp. SymC.cos]
MFASKLALAVASLLSATVSVRGHRYVQEIVNDGTKYTGYLLYMDPYMNPVPERIVCKIPGNGPVTDLSLIDVQCNGYTDGGEPGSTPAPIFATVAAGSQIALNWTTWPESHIGPMITYMALASSDITSWSPGTRQVLAVWFKVDEMGKDSSGKWAATDILSANDNIYTFTVPKNLKPGQYIICHEIIALHAELPERWTNSHSLDLGRSTLSTRQSTTVSYCIYYYVVCPFFQWWVWWYVRLDGVQQVINYNNAPALDVGHWPLFISVGLNIVIAFIVQCLLPPSLQTPVNTLQLIAATPFAMTSVLSDILADISIAGALCWLLHGSKTGLGNTDNLVSKLIVYAIDRCLLTSIVAVGEVIAFSASPHSLWYLAIDFTVGKRMLLMVLEYLNPFNSKNYSLCQQSFSHLEQ